MIRQKEARDIIMKLLNEHGQLKKRKKKKEEDAGEEGRRETNQFCITNQNIKCKYLGRELSLIGRSIKKKGNNKQMKSMSLGKKKKKKEETKTADQIWAFRSTHLSRQTKYGSLSYKTGGLRGFNILFFSPFFTFFFFFFCSITGK